MNRIVIGNISKPQGIKGEVKVTPLTDNVGRFENLKNIYIDGKSYLVKSVKVLQNGVFLSIDGFNDRDKAEFLRNKKIEIDRVDAVNLPDDRNFIVDVIGCKVFVGQNLLGVVKDILQYGSADVYVVKCQDSKKCMFPSIKRLVVSVDIKERKVVLDQEAFDDLVVYED